VLAARKLWPMEMTFVGHAAVADLNQHVVALG
jgi:hypothetical protein